MSFGNNDPNQSSAQRIYAFVPDGAGRLTVNWWDPVSAMWVWSNQGQPPTATVTSMVGAIYFGDSNAAALGGSGIYEFVRGSDGHLWVHFWSASTFQWVWADQGVPPGTFVTSGVGTIYFGDNNVASLSGSRLYAFVVGNDGHLWTNYWDPLTFQWGWGDLGAPPGAAVTSGVGALYFGDNMVSALGGSRLYAFVVANDGHLWASYWDPVGALWRWADQGVPPGTTASEGAGTIYLGDSNASDLSGSRIYAFVIGANGRLATNYWDPVTSTWGWFDLGAPPGWNVAGRGPGTIYLGDNNASSLARSQLYVFVAGTNGGIWAMKWDGSSWVWADQGGPPGTIGTTSVGTAYLGDNNTSGLAGSRMYSYSGGADGHLWLNWWSGTSWPWFDQGLIP